MLQAASMSDSVVIALGLVAYASFFSYLDPYIRSGKREHLRRH